MLIAALRAAFAASVPYLMLASTTLGGWMMVRAALACVRDGVGQGRFLEQKLATALFYGAHILPRSSTLAATVRNAQVADAAGAMLSDPA